MHIPLRPIPKEDTLRRRRTGQLTEIGRPKCLIHGRHLSEIYLVRKMLKALVYNIFIMVRENLMDVVNVAGQST